MSSFCTHIFFSKRFQHICVSLDVNFNESLNNNVVSFEQLGPESQMDLLSLLMSTQNMFLRRNSETERTFEEKLGNRENFVEVYVAPVY